MEESSTAAKTYTAEQVAKHRTVSSRVWVTYKGSVYDITEFIEAHPGGQQKIMLAAGGSIEPFWNMYKQHGKEEVLKILSKYKIGSLEGGEGESARVVLKDPFLDDPKRHPALITRTAKPCNAETPSHILSMGLVTPNDLFFVRNHLPVPNIDPKTWRLKIEGEGLRATELSLEDLQAKFKKHIIPATVQCTGNRRTEMKAVKTCKGLDWDHGAIGTAAWGGVLLKDVLSYAGLTESEATDAAHVHFVGLDTDPLTGEVYEASVPLHKVFGLGNDVLLAFEMNGEPLPRDHGGPLRVVCPGITGARSVKWLGKIRSSSEESHSFWQKKDYKVFNPSSEPEDLDWSSAPAIQETPINSAVCEPSPGSSVVLDEDDCFTVRGYAWAGGGRDVIRVDVTLDDGKSWQEATLVKLPGQKPGKAWAWALWETRVKVKDPGATRVRVCSRAVDEACNAQPDSVAAIWNPRGVCNTAWHRAEIAIERD